MKSFERFIGKECSYRKPYNEQTRARVVRIESMVNGLGESQVVFRLDNGDIVLPESPIFQTSPEQAHGWLRQRR